MGSAGSHQEQSWGMSALTTAERHVIESKGTERAFSGRFNFLADEGVYTCRKCGAPLFNSKDHFTSGCGWPSFDDEIPEAVRREVDRDGSRTEILCARCGGHLGHVFEGEKLTAKNVRHCVNGASLAFQPTADSEEEEETAVFGGGCFWCIEAVFQKLKGVKSTTSGYAGGTEGDANYKTVCTGRTEHIEVVKIVFSRKLISFGQLLEVFFDVHDPTSVDKQGADAGHQYRSVVFCQNERQRKQVEAFIALLNKSGKLPKKVVTQVSDISDFYTAEEYHLRYFDKNPTDGYCSATIPQKINKLKEKYADRWEG